MPCYCTEIEEHDEGQVEDAWKALQQSVRRQSAEARAM